MFFIVMYGIFILLVWLPYAALYFIPKPRFPFLFHQHPSISSTFLFKLLIELLEVLFFTLDHWCLSSSLFFADCLYSHETVIGDNAASSLSTKRIFIEICIASRFFMIRGDS